MQEWKRKLNIGKIINKDSVWVVSLISISVMYLLSFELQQRPFFLIDDNANYFFPSYVHNWRTMVEEHKVPFINFYQFLGNRHLGQGQTGVFYWPVYLGYGWGKILGWANYWLIDTLVVGHLVLGVVGMERWLQRLGVRRGWAVGWSLVWLTFPFMVGVARNWVFYTYLLGWLPWNFYFLEGLRKKANKKELWLWAVVKFHLMLQGYVQWVVVVGLIEAVWWGLTGRKRALNRLRQFLKCRWYWGVSGLIILLGAWVWLPVMYNKEVSIERRDKFEITEFAYQFVDGWKFVWAQVGRFVPEGIFVARSHLVFVGIVLVGLGGVLSSQRGMAADKIAKGYGLVATVFLLLSSALVVLVYWVPVLNWFRYPFKYFGVFLTFMIVAVAVKADRAKKKREWSMWLAGLVLALGSNVWVSWRETETGSWFSRLGINVSQQWQEYLEIIDEKKGRVMPIGESGLVGKETNEYLTFNFATLYKKYQFSGYDPLIAKRQYEETAGTYGLAAVSQKMDEETLKKLRKWGVRYWLVPNGDEEVKNWLEEVEREVVKLAETEKVTLYEDGAAAPLVEVHNGEVINWKVGGNGLWARVRGNEDKSEVRFNFLFQPWYYAWVDGVMKGRVGEEGGKLSLKVGQGEHEVRIEYVDWPFWMGAAISGWVGVVVLRKRDRVSNWMISG